MESAPTGCFKCGRPGHWSRDCPSSAPAAGNNAASSSSAPSSQIPNNDFQRSSAKKGTSLAPVPKLTKVRVQRPKLTPSMLLSEDGLGYVLRYFPKSFKYRGRGKEVSDLGNLIRLYSEWHSHLLPYYSFDQFVHKVRQVASTKRVKICINELRERVACGVHPNKLYEKQEENSFPSDDQGNQAMDQPSHDEENIPWKSADVVDTDTVDDPFQDSMLNEVIDNAMDVRHTPKPPSDEQNMDTTSSELTEEQRARMEANRLKAMERAQNISEEQRLRMEANRIKEQRARMEANRLKAMERAQNISEEQRLRMEANRIKALERAKARLQPNQD